MKFLRRLDVRLTGLALVVFLVAAFAEKVKGGKELLDMAQAAK